MDIFEKAIEFVLKHEGGYVFDPHDPGGETNFGISKKAYPNLNIKELTEEQAKAIYKRDYWDKIKGDELPHVVAFALLDTAINCGVFKASMWLQLSLNLLCKKGLKMDGVIGPKTVAALEECSKPKIVMYVLYLRLRHYLSLENDRFFRGWVERVTDLMKEIAKIGGGQDAQRGA